MECIVNSKEDGEVFKQYNVIEKDCWIQNNKKECYQTNLSKNRLTLRGVLYWTRSGAGGAELVDHSGDVLHLPVHHSLHVVHVEQVEPLQTTLQSRDLAPGVAQAGWHPIQLHLGRGRVKWGEEIYLCAENTKQVDYWSHQPPSLFYQPSRILE